MIRGKVARNLDACIELTTIPPGGPPCAISAVIDTGFNSELAAPIEWLEEIGALSAAPTTARLADNTSVDLPTYAISVIWHGTERMVRVLAAGDEFLVGMRFLLGSRVTIDVQQDGAILVEPLPETA